MGLPTETFGGHHHVLAYVYDPVTETNVPLTQPGVVTVASSGILVDGVDPTITATVKDYVNSNPLTVVLTDTNGDPYVAGGATGLTDAQLRTTPVPVSVSGVSTAAKQDTGNASIASIDGKVPVLGQALAAASVPVILPAATVTTLTPPAAITGFATSAKQDTGNTSLGSIDGKLPATIGQKAASASLSVIPASDATPPANRTATGSLTGIGNTVTVVSDGAGTGSIVIGGAWIGTIAFIGVDASSNTTQIFGIRTSTGDQQAATTVSGSWLIPAGAWSSIGVQAISWTSGTASIAVGVGIGSNVVGLNYPLPSGTNSLGQVTANAGTNLNTSALALEASQLLGNTTLTSIYGVQPSTLAFDGQTVAFSTDYVGRRLQEAQYLQALTASMTSMIGSESENSQRMGFELR